MISSVGSGSTLTCRPMALIGNRLVSIGTVVRPPPRRVGRRQPVNQQSQDPLLPPISSIPRLSSRRCRPR